MEAGELAKMTKGGCGFDVCGLKYISHRYKFIYFEVPKTGTRSVLDLLTEPAELTRMERRLGFLEYSHYRRFAFVRNPWGRLLSCYQNKIKKDKNFQATHFQNGVMKKFHKFNVFYAGMPFGEFVHAVGKIPDEFADGHFASQYRRLILENEIVVDHLARFETFRDEIGSFLTTVGMDVSLEVPHLNSSETGKPYQEYYDEETIRVVEERFKEDIRLFGYQFDQTTADSPVRPGSPA